MIQPINLINSNRYSYKNINFKNAVPPTVEAPAKPAISTDDSSVFLKYMQEKDKQEKIDKRNGYIVSGVLTAAMIGSIFFMPKIIQKTGNKFKSKGEMAFASLKNDKNIPTLDTCKSINEKLRTFLQTQVDLAKVSSEDLKAIGINNAPNRLILYGAPGSGKSFFAKIFAKTLDADYKEVLYSDFNSKWVGEGNENLKRIFEGVLKDAKKEPNKKFVLTFNEIDTMVQSAENLMANGHGTGGGTHYLTKLEQRSTFLNYIDRISEEAPNVTIIGTTNISPKNKGLDGAAMSRFKNVMEISYPDKTCLLEALKAHIQELKDGKEFIKLNKENLDKFAQSMSDKKSSFRDLNNIIETSKNYFLRDYIKDRNAKYKLEYLEKAQQSISLTDGEMAGIV